MDAHRRNARRGLLGSECLLELLEIDIPPLEGARIMLLLVSGALASPPIVALRGLLPVLLVTVSLGKIST